MTTPRSASTSTTRRSVLAAGTSLPLLGLLAACGGGSNTGGSDASGAPVQGGVLKFATDSDLKNYDPQQLPNLEARVVARQIVDSLTEQDPESGEIKPWLAESWDVNEDVTTFTFHLKSGVTFSDGTALTADVVKQNFERIVSIGSLARIAAGMLRDLDTVTADDDSTVTVTFKSPNAQFLQATSTTSLGLLAPDTLKLDPAEVAGGKVIGTGPFTLESYTQGQGLVLKAREDYAWPSPIYTNTGRAYLDEIDISFITEPTTLAGSVASGQTDFAYLLDVSTVSTVEAGAKLLKSDLPAIAIPLVPLVYRPVFEDAATRAALITAVDREAIVKTVSQGQYTPATGVLTTKNPGYVDLSDKLTYDPDASIAALEKAGWTEVGDDGIRSKTDGTRLEAETKYFGTTYETMFQLLQQQFKKVGLDFTLTPLATEEEKDLDKYDYDFTTWSQSRADVDVLRTVYSSFYQNQSFLYDHPDEELDELLTKLQTTIDADERLEASKDAQSLILERGYTIPLFDRPQFSGYGTKLSGVHTDIEGKPLLVDVSKQA